MGAGSGKGSKEKRKLKERARRKAEKAARYAASRSRSGEKAIVRKTGTNGEITKRGNHVRLCRGDTRGKDTARKEVAELNTAARAKRSNKEQIEYLDFRLGAGVGAVRERRRLV